MSFFVFCFSQASRLNLVFDGEAAEWHALRRRVAESNRLAFEANMQYRRSIEALADDTALQLPLAQFERIVERIGDSAELLHADSESHRSLLCEVPWASPLTPVRTFKRSAITA